MSTFGRTLMSTVGRKLMSTSVDADVDRRRTLIW